MEYIDFFFHFISGHQAFLELIGILGGFAAGALWRNARYIIIGIHAIKILLDITRWYMRHHPKGQEMAKHTDIDERIERKMVTISQEFPELFDRQKI